MKFKPSMLVSLTFFAITVFVAVWLYPRLPVEVTTHWDYHGHDDGYTPRIWDAAMPALVILGLAVLTWLLPVISPRRFEIKPFSQAYLIVMLSVRR